MHKSSFAFCNCILSSVKLDWWCVASNSRIEFTDARTSDTTGSVPCVEYQPLRAHSYFCAVLRIVYKLGRYHRDLAPVSIWRRQLGIAQPYCHGFQLNGKLELSESWHMQLRQVLSDALDWPATLLQRLYIPKHLDLWGPALGVEF